MSEPTPKDKAEAELMASPHHVGKFHVLALRVLRQNCTPVKGSRSHERWVEGYQILADTKQMTVMTGEGEELYYWSGFSPVSCTIRYDYEMLIKAIPLFERTLVLESLADV